MSEMQEILAACEKSRAKARKDNVEMRAEVQRMVGQDVHRGASYRRMEVPRYGLC